LEILDLRDPTFLDKSVMERMLAVCLKVFVAGEMDRYPEGMGILWTDLAADPKVFHPGYSGQFLGCRKKISLSGRTCGMFDTKGYSVFHGYMMVITLALEIDNELIP
jgi:hypothetical protein